MTPEDAMIDLTSDSDDELQCTGSVACSDSKKQPSRSKIRPLVQTQDTEKPQPSLVDKRSARFLSKGTVTSPYSGKSSGVMSNNFMNSPWDAFGESRQRNASIFRTPSPFTQELVDGGHSTNTGGRSSEKHERKRFREGSLSMGSKRFRSLSPDTADRETHWVDIETVDDDDQYEEYLGSPPPIGREATADELDHGVIILDHDDELEDLIEISSSNWNHFSQKKGPPSLNPDYVLIDLDDYEDHLFREVELEAPRQSPSPGRSGTIIASRNMPIAPPWAVEESIETELGKFEVGDVVELKTPGFLRISFIMKNLQTDHVKLRGCRLERARELNGILPKKANELYLNIEIEIDDPRPPMEQGMEEVDLEQVRAVRKTRLTNQIFPSCSFREKGGYYNLLDAEFNAPCAVRWKYSCKYLSARDRWHNRWNERSVELLKEGDFSTGDRLATFVDDTMVRTLYRGNTIPGGAYPGLAKTNSTKPSTAVTSRKSSDKPIVLFIDDQPEVEQLRRSVSVIHLSNKSEKVYSSSHEDRDIHDQRLQPRDLSLSHNVIDLSNSALATPPYEGLISSSRAQPSKSVARKQNIRLAGQKYTYGDSFCGAGGATRGALMAGLKVVWGFDANNHACSSWRLNFPDAILYEEWADQLIQRGLKSSCLRCDILHLSPPCQYFSPAHTVIGKDDEMNMASLFACGMLLDVAKPRIATLEQTFGIVLLPRFQLYFNTLIQMFTDRGFSVRWKICHLQNWGLPQRRQRLIIIASCPGEVLPEFPPFTHADPNKGDRTLPPWVSVNSVIRNIPRGAPNHDLELMEAKPLRCRPWSGASIAPRCITTHGGQNYHPSGKRGFTNREYACLQGFPMNHRFSQVNVKKQIGNAVPPCIAKVLFSWIKKALEKADNIAPEDEQAGMLHSGNFQTEAIVVD